MMPNKPDAVNPAMSLSLTIETHWRRITDLERWPIMNNGVRPLAVIALPLGAFVSIAFMLRVGQRNESRILMAFFTGWVLAPFVALAWSHVVAKRWSEPAKRWLAALTLIVVVCSTAIYGYVAFGQPRAKPAFFFLVVPFASLILVALLAAMRTKNVKS